MVSVDGHGLQQLHTQNPHLEVWRQDAETCHLASGSSKAAIFPQPKLLATVLIKRVPGSSSVIGALSTSLSHGANRPVIWTFAPTVQNQRRNLHTASPESMS